MKLKLAVIAAITAGLLTGCATQGNISNSVNFITNTVGATNNTDGPIKDTTSYSSKALLKDYELTEGAEILAYGTAKFKTYGQFHEQKGWAREWDSMGPMGDYHTPGGLYELEYLTFQDRAPVMGLNETLEWTFKIPDDQKVILKKWAFRKIIPGRDNFKRIIITHEAANALTEPKKAFFKEIYIYRFYLFKHNRGLPTTYFLSYSNKQQLDRDFALYVEESPDNISPDLRFFSPYTFLFKKVIPDAGNNYQTLTYKGESDGKLIFEYTKTTGTKTGKPELIKVNKSAEGVYNIKGVELVLMEEDGKKWYRLRSFFNGDKTERYWDMLPFTPRGIEILRDENSELKQKPVSYYSIMK